MTREETPAAKSGNADQARSRSVAGLVPWPARRAWWAFEEHVLWRAGDTLRVAASEARWPLQRLGWGLQRRIAWPVQDRLADRGPAARGGVALLLVAAAGGALAGGVLISSSGSDPASAPVPRLADTRSPNPVSVVLAHPSASGPVLQGVTPDLRATERDAAAAGSSPADPSATGSSSPPSAAPSAPAAEVPSPADVPKAMDVANRFANAFVLYEIGKADAGVRQTFHRTAAEPLARSLAKRPPRQPDGVQVPRAKVLNVVPGPLHGTRLSVSVALLRLGATSELRLQLENRQKLGWQVSDVRG